jgi:hypothetical protein
MNDLSGLCIVHKVTVFILSGAGQEVGRSCILLEFKGKKILLDFGIHPGEIMLTVMRRLFNPLLNRFDGFSFKSAPYEAVTNELNCNSVF